MSNLAAPRSFPFGLRVAVWVLLSALLIYFWWGLQKHYLGPIEREYLKFAGPRLLVFYFIIPSMLSCGAAFLLGLIGKQQSLERSLVVLGLSIASPFIFTVLLLTLGCFVETVVFHMRAACL